MSVVSPIRYDLVPHGHCVSSQEIYSDAIPEIFAQIDAGNRQKSLLEAAARACLTCPQYAEFCEQGSEDFATAMWLRGAGVLFSGGRHVLLDTSSAPVGMIDEPKLKWEMSMIVADPEIAVRQIQRAVRSGQFRMVGKTPKGAEAEADNFLLRILENTSDPDFCSNVYEPLGDQARIGAEYMIRALYQQKDWKRFSLQNGKGGKPSTMDRYDPGTLDHVIADPIIKRYLRVVLEVQELGYTDPANKALRLPSTFYSWLKEKYFNENEIGWPEFDKIVSTARNNPVVAVQRRLGVQAQIRAAELDVPETYVQKAARGGGSAEGFNARVDRLYDQYGDGKIVTRGVVRNAVSQSPTNPETIIRGYTQRVARGMDRYRVQTQDEIVRVEDITAAARNTRSETACMDTLRRYRQNVRALRGMYQTDGALDEDFTDTRLRRFARASIQLDLDTRENADIARSAAREYKQRVATLTRLAEGTLPDWHIRAICVQSSRPVSYAEARRSYKIKTVNKELDDRIAESGGELTGLDPSTVERIVALYPEAEVDSVVDTVFELINSGMLVMAIGERNEVRDLNWQNDLDKIQDPKSHKYLTFSAALSELISDRRLAFAHHYNLMPLLYGTASNTLLIEQEIYEGWDLDVLFESIVGPNCAALLARAEHPKLPISDYVLNDDLKRFKGLLESGNTSQTDTPEISLTVQGVQKSIIVAGGRIFLLRERDAMKSWKYVDEGIKSWVENRVKSAYPPQQREQMTQVVAEALEHGVLTLLGSSPREFQLAFSSAFYEENTDNLDRAAIAHQLGLDRLLYGSDLGAFLSGRIGNDIVSIRLRRATSPRIHDITDRVLAQTELADPPAIDTTTTVTSTAKTQATKTRKLVLPESYVVVDLLQSSKTGSSDRLALKLPEEILTEWGLVRDQDYFFTSGQRLDVIASSKPLRGANVSKRLVTESQRSIILPADLVRIYSGAEGAPIPIGVITWNGDQSKQMALITARNRILSRIGGLSLTDTDDQARIEAFKQTISDGILRQSVVLDATEMKITPALLMRATFPELEEV